MSQGTLQQLVERLAEQATLTVQWSESAKRVVADRGTPGVAFENLPLTDVLLALTEPRGLVVNLG